MNASVGAQDELQRLREAVAQDPRDFIAWVLLSEAALDHGDAQAGLTAAQRALGLRPDHPEALARLGRALWTLGRHAEAAAALRSASAQAPQHPGMALWLGHALEDAGEAEAAAQAYEHAYRLLPEEPLICAHLLNWRRKLCDWRDIETLARQVKRSVAERRAAIEPFAFLSEDASPAEQLACAKSSAARIARRVAALPPVAMGGEETVRIGLLSNGFGAHPTGLLTVAFLESLASVAGIETHLFASTADDASAIRRRLAACVKTLHDVSGMRHDAIAHRIRDQRIEILYDLRGWGGGGVPEVLARRPAPVQVNWLAYPGTSGAPWIDYALADRFVLPPDLAPDFSEAIAWLPRCFQPSDTQRDVPAARARAKCGLPESGFVFACFNNTYKLNPASFGRMMAVLAGVGDSVLWLLSGPGRSDERLRTAAQAADVDPARLVFMQKKPHAEYLAHYRHADLFLDTNPYNAHTTASDALWAGCPVLTRPGRTFASRVAGSLNHHLGLQHMNVETDAAFIARAIALGNGEADMTALRSALRQARQASGLFDMPGFARDFAACARIMAMRHRQGLTPASFG